MLIMNPAPEGVFQRLVDRFGKSRDFTISFVLHLIIVMIFGTTVLFQAVQEPSDFQPSGPLVHEGDRAPAPPREEGSPAPEAFDVATAQPTPAPLKTITTPAPNPLNFTVPTNIAPGPTLPSPVLPITAEQPGIPLTGEKLSASQAAAIKDFTRDWAPNPGQRTGNRPTEFEFTAYIGQYEGGDWNSTIRVTKDRIETGSLPNLLYLMSFWSKDKIKTNYKNVKAIKLDSDEIFSVKPPFIFLTGTRDFQLTNKEVENLREYIRNGGCIWGDASLPGPRSRFDIAFKREMRRVIPDVDKNFEPLATTHAIFTQGYFPQIKALPPGVNFYANPVEVLRFCGEIAVIYSSNDYGNMWQVGLNQQGQIDTRQNEHHQYVALDGQLYANRGLYVRNISPTSLKASFEFGTNVVIHLLTRWDEKVRNAPAL